MYRITTMNVLRFTYAVTYITLLNCNLCVTSQIMRVPEFNIQTGKTLSKGFAFKIIKPENFLNCITYCGIFPNCRSVSFVLSEKECRLNVFTSSSGQDVLQDYDGAVYVNKSDFPAELGSKCIEPCNMLSACVHGHCIPIFEGKFCTEPRSLPHARHSYAGPVPVGGTVQYSCTNESEVTGNPTITCMDEMLWSYDEHFCCKVWQYKNVALNKPVIMSSTWNNDITGMLIGANAVDGIVSKTVESIAHAAYETHPWLRIDLEHVYFIHHVIMFNRMDDFGRALHDVEIKVGNSTAWEGMTRCGVYIGPSETGLNHTVECQENLAGRFVTFKIVDNFSPFLPGQANGLGFAEIFVLTPLRLSCI